ncbi:unnamed protein product [Meloidogyne enterolobii]|uniref:Uncharacterized protein n=1 Tax=Meloidogyne enterolobii TaxID=390850 RepID=A0ACB0Z8B0_MELEN
MSENQPTFFYGVAYGYNRGVFSTYKEAMAAMKGFPQAVYKKFKNREDAEEFVQKSKPDATLFDAKETDTDDKFYAVARGRVIGIFKDLETVKKNTHGFPKPMHKKFATFAEAKIDETAKSPRRKRTHAETTDGNTDWPAVRNVARKRTSGKVGDTDESEGGELDHTQIMNESTEDEEGGGADQEEEEKEGEEAVSNKNMDNKDKIENGGEVEEKKVEEEGDKSEVIMDEGKGQKDEGNPSNAVEEQQKHAIMEE